VPLAGLNRLFRAVPVPASEHRIVLEYRAPMVRLGGALSMATLAFLLAMLAIESWRFARTGVLPHPLRCEEAADPDGNRADRRLLWMLLILLVAWVAVSMPLLWPRWLSAWQFHGG